MKAILTATAILAAAPAMADHAITANVCMSIEGNTQCLELTHPARFPDDEQCEAALPGAYHGLLQALMERGLAPYVQTIDIGCAPVDVGA